jgi:hypothetical protein
MEQAQVNDALISRHEATAPATHLVGNQLGGNLDRSRSGDVLCGSGVHVSGRCVGWGWTIEAV